MRDIGSVGTRRDIIDGATGRERSRFDRAVTALILAAGTLLHVVRVVASLTRVVHRLSMPWLLLGTRLWLGQIVLIQQAMAIMLAAGAWQGGAGGGGLGGASILAGLSDVFYVLGPLFLMAGLLTRPVALAMLIQVAVLAEPSTSAAPEIASATAPELALLAWLLVVGPDRSRSTVCFDAA
jgi:hypothetical protein